MELAADCILWQALLLVLLELLGSNITKLASFLLYI